jgi:hypothetical protein
MRQREVKSKVFHSTLSYRMQELLIATTPEVGLPLERRSSASGR